MITFSELRALTSVRFPGKAIGISRMLTVWCDNDGGNELPNYLENTGISQSKMTDALEPFCDDPDKELMIQCLTSVKGESVKGVHILLILGKNKDHKITSALIDSGLNCKVLYDNIQKYLKDMTLFSRLGMGLNTQTSVLLEYGRDLTALAAEGLFHELCDRPGESDRLMDVILRKRKGNPVLTGPAGIGKTAVVELFAKHIIRRRDEVFKNYRLFEISMGKLVAGTKYRGEFEARFETIMKNLEQASPAILFIDEMHLLFGAGRAEGGAIDAANLLKPFLARDEMRVIGATTSAEYQQYIVRDKALARRFQEIRLEEPFGETLFNMVKHQADALSRHHGIKINDKIIKRAIAHTDKHLLNRSQPDKSIDLLDSAAVAARRKNKKQLECDHLLTTLSNFTGTPVGMLTGEDRASLRNLSNALKKRVIGQDQAIEKVVSGIVHRKLDMGQENRPLGVFLLAGSTGVGKTELARAVAVEFIGSEKKLIHIDLGEHSGAGSVHSLIGTPPGYAGEDNNGLLIKGLQENPSCILLFDEVEKAHPDVHRLLLGLLDNGRITSGKGERFDARQCVIFLTTNALTARDLNKPVPGFNNGAKKEPVEMLSKAFPKEFLGRMDELILFNTLNKKDIRNILKLRFREAETRLAGKGIILDYNPKRLLDHLSEHLVDKQTGARGIARLLERKLLQPLALALLESEPGKKLTIKLDNTFFENGMIYF